MEKIKTFVINGKEIKTEKNSFIAFTSKIDEKWYKIKFTKKTNPPKEKGLYNLTVDLAKCSVEKEIYTNKNGENIENTIIWIHDIINCVEFTEEEYEERAIKQFDGIFDNGEDLPF